MEGVWAWTEACDGVGNDPSPRATTGVAFCRRTGGSDVFNDRHERAEGRRKSVLREEEKNARNVMKSLVPSGVANCGALFLRLLFTAVIDDGIETCSCTALRSAH